MALPNEVPGMQALGNISGNMTQIPRYTQQQQDVLSQILGNLGGQLKEPGMGFGPIAEQAKSQFQEQTLPSILERLTSMGGEGLRGSDIGRSLSQAGAGLNKDLAAMQAQYQQGMFGPLLQAGLMPQYETLYRPQGPSFGSSLGQSLASGVGQIAGQEAPGWLSTLFNLLKRLAL